MTSFIVQRARALYGIIEHLRSCMSSFRSTSGKFHLNYLQAQCFFFFLALICNRAKSLALFSKEIFQLKTSNIIFYSHTK